MENIIRILKENPQIDDFRITKTEISSNELFFIKEKLQMNRGKDVTHINVTVYKNIEENGKKFKGSSSTKVSPLDTEEEIKDKIDKAVLAASFVKNEYYELPKPTNDVAPEIPSKFKDGDPVESIGKLVKDLYSQDNNFDSFVNSCEFFIDNRHTRIVNSNGIDVEFDSYQGEIELIVESDGEEESVELFTDFHFSDYNSEWIKNVVSNQLKNASLRAKAVPMPNVKGIPVIIRSESALEFWQYFGFVASAQSKYEHLHQNNIGDNIQGDAIKGDKLNITLKPVIPNSIASAYYDGDGVFLKDVNLIEDGVLKNFLAPSRYAQYFNTEVTGQMRNMVVAPGKKSVKELKSEPYLEVISFSAFQMDPITGNFGGEFRLAIYFDGEKEIPVKFGAVTANMNNVQNEMYLSKETITSEAFVGPEIVLLKNVTIAGN